jgi:hypothetical protein
MTSLTNIEVVCMAIHPGHTPIYHITDITNLNDILAAGGLHSDAAMQLAGADPTQIGFAPIKLRRLTQYRVPCCDNRFVGEFVPFYFCPRSPMLYTVNNGNTGRPKGCQSDILHLVTDVLSAGSLNRSWAVSDGNAGASYTTFSNAAGVLDNVNWAIVNSNNWASDRMHAKASEFLVADFVPMSIFTRIGCQNSTTAAATLKIVNRYNIKIAVDVIPNWYY